MQSKKFLTAFLVAGLGVAYAESINTDKLTFDDNPTSSLNENARFFIDKYSNQKTPPLQKVLAFSKDKTADMLYQKIDTLKLTGDNLKQARNDYLNSLDVATTQNMINKLQDLTTQLQNTIDPNSGSNPALNPSKINNASNDLKSQSSVMTNDLNDYQDLFNQVKLKLDTIHYWGLSALAWGEHFDRRDYGWNGRTDLGDNMRRITMYLYGQGNVNTLKDKRNKISNDLNQISTAANTLFDANRKLGTDQATQKALTQINALITDLQNSISGSGSDAQDKLDKTKKEAQDALIEFIGFYQSMIALEQMKQQATQTLAKEQQSLSNLASNFSSNMTKVNFASSLATDSRLAKLSNPYSQDTEFAAYIEEIKNKSLAANTIQTKDKSVASDFTSSLASEVYAYDLLRFKKNNNLWGNVGTIIGNSNSVNSISGVFSFGYDAWVKNMVLGAYGSYAYTTNGIANTSSKNQSHNADVGFYSRFFLGQNEIDLNLGESFGFNFLQFQESLLGTTLKSDSVSFQTHLDLTYGYVFKIGKGWFSKPFIGINYNYGYNLGMDAKATDISMGFDPFQTHFGAIRAGLELRKYFNDNQSYFYIAPAFYQGVLFENSQSVQTTIYESSFVQNATDFNQNQSIDTSFLLKAGGEWQAGDNIFINISVGAKLGNLNQYGMLNLGGRWMF